MSSLAARLYTTSQPSTTKSRISNKSSLPIISATSSRTGTSSHNRPRRLHFTDSVQRLKEKLSFRMLVRIQQSATLEPLPPSSNGSEFGNSDGEFDSNAKYEDKLDYMELAERLKDSVDYCCDMRDTQKLDESSDKGHYQLNITGSVDVGGSGGGSQSFSRADQEDTTLLSTDILCTYTEPSSQADLTLSPSAFNMIQNDNLKFVFGQKTLSPHRMPSRSKSWTQLYAAASDEDSHWNRPFLDRYLEDCSGQAFH